MPQVSVVIPCYNRLDLLPRAIRSIELQDFHDMEVVLVNDGGRWDENLVCDYGRLQCRVVQRENGGPGAARNTGILASDSEYIAYLDDDDEWHPVHLRNLVAFAEYSNSEMVYAVADVQDSGNRVRFWGDCQFNKFLQDSFHTMFPLSSCLHRRKLIERAGAFDEHPELIGPEDCEFVIRCSDVSLPKATRQCTVTMHRERSMTRNPRNLWVDALSYVVDKLGYREDRQNWLMLYRAVVAAHFENRKVEFDRWSRLLDLQLPNGIHRSGVELSGAVSLSPSRLKAYCRDMENSG